MSSAALVDREAEPSRVSYDGLDQVLGFHLRQAQGAMHRRIIALLSAVDLTQKQAAVLWLTGANPGASQSSIGGALRMDRATTMAIIDRLEARDVLTRERSRVDRRRQELRLSSAGQDLLIQVKSLIQTHEDRFAARFTEAELDLLKRLLGRVYLEDLE
jgi:DNA-binding MarR family transcriptional regulator